MASITASAQTDPEHAYLLAAYYYREHDYNAVLLYLKIAAPRLPHARYDLGLCHKLGIGTQRDPQLARKRFDEASALGCTEADYEKSGHINRLENPLTLLIYDDNFAFDNEGRIILN